ncbi:MAG: hypothetical protein AAGA77_18105 [Bacteroidota bacterium]
MNGKFFSFTYDLQPISKSLRIKIFGVYRSNPKLLVEKTVRRFSFRVKLPIDRFTDFYIVASPVNAQLNNQFVASFTATSGRVCINEHTTIAALYCFNKFASFTPEGDLQIGLSRDRFKICQGMKNNFVYEDGELSKVIISSPNGLETNSYPMFNSLATILHYCQEDEFIYEAFLRLCGNKKMEARSNIEALLNLAHEPFDNAEEIYNLVKEKEQTFKPSLRTIKLRKTQQRIPDHWSLSIKVNHSGAENFLISGPGYIDFDKNDRVWITNNTRQGTSYSCSFCVVLNSDGTPADFSPVFGGGLLGGGFGVTVNNKKDKIYLGNYGWGPVQCNPQKGSVTAISSQGKLLSPSNGFTNKLSRVQGMKFDSQGNLWMSSWGTQAPLAPSSDTVFQYKGEKSAVVVYIDADPKRAVSFEFESPHCMTFDLIVDEHDNVFATNSGDAAKGIRSSIYKLKLENNKIIKLASWKSKYENKKQKTIGGEGFRQVCLNSKGEVFVGGIASNRILKFDNDLNYLRDFTKNIDAPWGVTIDGDDTIYSANFVQEKTLKNSKTRSKGFGGPFGVTIIKNEKDKKSKFLNLPTGGAEVTLANGMPLFGNTPRIRKNKKKPSKLMKSFQPLMRMTGTRIDKVGNLWAINNWKPAQEVDLRENPGGDGLVIFIGAAVPNK